jgi:dihydrofolate reductase
MRKLIVTEFMTLDGVIESPHLWSFPYWNDEIAKFKHAETFTSDALLLGRVTYEGFAAAWSGHRHPRQCRADPKPDATEPDRPIPPARLSTGVG